MAAIPKPDSIIDAIDRAFVAKAELTPRGHLGASVLGKECERQAWYGFRWALIENQFSGRMLRLFARGQREEEWFATLLKLAGCEVQLTDSNGQQFRFFEPELGGHCSGSLDGIASGIPEAPETFHVLEFKTHNAKSFAKLVKDGVQKSKPEHFGQMQLYMRWTDLDRALYLAVNKDDDSLYAERVAYDPAHADTLVNKARRVIEAQTPPSRLSDDPAFFTCKFCDFHGICHGRELPSVTCRTCLHSTPVVDTTVDAKWHCAKWDGHIPIEESLKAQPCHRYIPALIPWAEAVDATDDGDVRYLIADGRQFMNGESQGAYASPELRDADPSLIGNPEVEELRAKADGRFIKVAEAYEYCDTEEEVPF